MKKYLLLVIILIFPGIVFSQEIIDQRVATVNLIKPEVIWKKQLDQTAEILKQNGIVKSNMEILETMVGDVLLKQGAERAGIKVTSPDVIKSIRRQLVNPASGLTEQQVRGMTDQQIKEIVSRETGVPWETYEKSTIDTMQLRMYVEKVKASKVNNIPNPTNSEINKFYNENTRQFFISKTVRFDHILVDLRMLTTKEEHDRARDRALSYERELKSGAKTFDQLIAESDDARSKYSGGNFGALRIDDMQAKALLGDSFFDAIFDLKKDQISGVIRSNAGYHIIRMNEIMEPRILSLTDIIDTERKITVQDRIREYLTMRKREDVFRECVEELVSDLRKEADIKFFI